MLGVPPPQCTWVTACRRPSHAPSSAISRASSVEKAGPRCEMMLQGGSCVPAAGAMTCGTLK